MNRQDQLAAIRQKCIEANLDILGLKFGCRVQRVAGEIDTLAGPLRAGENHEYRVNLYREKGEWGELFVYDCERPEIESWVIIGRPIRLDDCAQILKEKYWLIESWRPGYLDDQPDSVINGIHLRML